MAASAVSLTAATQVSIGAPRAAASTYSPVGLYAGPSNVSTVQSVNAAAGNSIHYVMDFLDPSNWALMDDPSWFLNNWGSTGYQMIWGVPMLPNDGSSTLSAGATGAYNHYFSTLAQKLVAGGQGSSIIRLGWEFNGGWFPWAAAGNPAAFIRYWQQIVTTMRSVPGANFKFEWNPTIGQQQIAPDSAWPGSGYVDIVGLDVYDANWPSLQPPSQQWQTFLTEPYGLNWLASFGAQMGKPLALPEWGLWNDGSPEGSGDNATFIDQMTNWIYTHNVVNAEYWDYGTSAFSSNPLAYSAFIRDLGGYSTTASSVSGSSVGASSSSSSGRGYWLVAADGGVFTFGDARFFGSTGAVRLNRPIVGMASTPDGGGYWLVAADGGVFTFGDARFFGSTGAVRLNRPIVGVASTPDGGGYWLVAADGGVFTFGNAGFYGAAGPGIASDPAIGISASSDGHGYWLATSSGQVVARGDAAPYGSGTKGSAGAVVGISPTADQGGYLMATSQGGVAGFGSGASLPGGISGVRLTRPVVGLSHD